MSKIEKIWKLPPPEDLGDEYIWHPVVRIGKTVPWGYEQDLDDPDILLPIPEELELLEEAKRYLKRYPSREVANWLTEQTGRYISHTGLLSRVKSERQREKEASESRYWAERYKEAQEKAERLEKQRIGARTRREQECSSGSETGED
jgi:hypothetical protein